MTDKRPWGTEEDQLLQHIFENSGLSKWSHIAKQLSQEMGGTPRNGKQCRERYLTHIESLNHKQEWNRNLEERLVQLHNEIGNKWAVIGHRMGGISDNSIKNHFYSLLRRALRKLNVVIQRQHIKEVKDFKPPIIYKIVEVADQKSKLLPQGQYNFPSFSQQLKNELLEFSFQEGDTTTEQSEIDTETAKILIGKVSEFMNNYKKRGRKSRKGSGNNLLSTRRYESKRINAEQQVSQSEDQLDDIYPDVLYRSNRSRKQSYTSLTNEVIIEEQPLQGGGIRTRARSQGNFNPSYFEKSDFTMNQQKVEELPQNIPIPPIPNVNGNISDHLEIQGIMSGYQLMEEQPVTMKKKKGSFLVEQGSSVQQKMDLEFKFFDDSPFHLRVLPSIEVGIHPESHLEEELLQ